jgi:diguanylate cyclase (GGDEF)-like protein
MKTANRSSALSPPDPAVLSKLRVIHNTALSIVVAIALPTFLLWIAPSVKEALVPQLRLIKANTAFLILLSALSTALSHPRLARRWTLLGTALGLFVALVATITALEFADIVLFPHLDTLFAPDPNGIVPGRMALQSSLALALIGLSAATIRIRSRYLSPWIDGIAFSMTLFMLIVVFGYIFGAMHLFNLGTGNRLYPSAFIALILLALVVFNRRAEYGFFSVLLGSGVGGKTARLAAPWAILLPFLLTVARGLVVRWHLLPEEYGTEGASAILSILGFFLLLVLCRRSDRSEVAIRNLSLRDELTRLHNRRGFYVLAEQALRLAQRARSPFFVLFIDLDDLKLVNDTFGHEIGSDLLREIASLIDHTFRETDVVGRLGGDEFVVAGRADVDSVVVGIQRLEEATTAANQAGARPYLISYSLGYVFSDGDRETLDQLLQRADMIMYESKRTKKRLRGEAQFTPV